MQAQKKYISIEVKREALFVWPLTVERNPKWKGEEKHWKLSFFPVKWTEEHMSNLLINYYDLFVAFGRFNFEDFA